MASKEAILFSDSRSASISLVIPALNEGLNLAPTLENFRATLPEPSEILVVDDGSTDLSIDSLPPANNLRVVRLQRQGAARARNIGARQAQGEIIVFADAHVRVTAGWWEPLAESLADPRVGAVAPVISVMGHEQSKGFGMRWNGPSFGVEWLPPQGNEPHPVGLAPGCLLAMRRNVFQATGGFDDGMILWGMEDSELSLRLWLLGYELRLIPSVEVAHLFREKHPYRIDWSCVIHNMLRVAFCHFHEKRIERVVGALKRYRDFARALSLFAQSDVLLRRQSLERERVRDDQWFFERFPMSV
jgi:GT2 family glycosyltransferase